MRATHLRRALASTAAAAGLLACAQAAVAGQLTYSLDPPYIEGTTGAAGWYRTDVTATYRCTPAAGEEIGSCPVPETFTNGAGVSASGGAVRIRRTATFLRTRPSGGTTRDSVNLESAPDVPLRLDTVAPPLPVVTAPAPPPGGGPLVLTPGQVLLAAYTCGRDALSGSGPDACTGSVASGAPIDTGVPGEPSTWGARTFVATNRDVAGNAATVTLTYGIDGPAPPAPPRVTVSPGTTPLTQPRFAWQAGESGGSFDWQVTGAGGALVAQGTTPAAEVTLPAALAAGPYAFRVRQRADDGRLGDWSSAEPFTVLAATAVTPVATGVRPRTVNARALRPAAGARLSARGTLRWRRNGGAQFYNLQVFRLVGTRYVKVLSAFPRGVSYRLPKGKVVAGRRYAWRVWPYVQSQRRYSRTPLGMSWFVAVKPS
jgi:hypothetical protein